MYIYIYFSLYIQIRARIDFFAIPKPAFDSSPLLLACAFLLPILCLGIASPSAFPACSHHDTASKLAEGRGKGWKGWGRTPVGWGMQGRGKLMDWRMAGPRGPCLTCHREAGAESSCWEKWATEVKWHPKPGLESWGPAGQGPARGASTLQH